SSLATEASEPHAISTPPKKIRPIDVLMMRAPSTVKRHCKACAYCNTPTPADFAVRRGARRLVWRRSRPWDPTAPSERREPTLLRRARSGGARLLGMISSRRRHIMRRAKLASAILGITTCLAVIEACSTILGFERPGIQAADSGDDTSDARLGE